MKNAALLLLAIFSLGLSAQNINDKGLYVDSDGELFNGTLSNTKNGTRSELTVRAGQLNGEATYYFASGQIMEKGMFVNGQKDQKWTRYNEKGGITAIAFYTLGKKSGTWLVYDDSGNKRFEMVYSDGAKTGIWTSWDETGKVTETKDYSKVN